MQKFCHFASKNIYKWPKISLDKIHSKFLLAPPLSVISKIFEVSTTVMAARLDYLELKYIDDTN